LMLIICLISLICASMTSFKNALNLICVDLNNI
jgi:hypothetical protein